MTIRQSDRAGAHPREGRTRVSDHLQRLSPSEVYVRAGVIHAGRALVAAGIGFAHYIGRRWSTRLLYHMGEFVSEKAAALRRSRRILARRKRDVAPEREGTRMDALRCCTR